MNGAKRVRLWRMGLATLFGRPQGFFIPHRYADQVPRSVPPYRPFEALLDRNRPAFGKMLDLMEGLSPALRAIGSEPPPAPRWEQSWFPRLDGAAAYSIVRHYRPARIVEVGSGHSTRFLARAADDEGTAVAITAIDPAPRADLGRLPVTLVPSTVQAAGTAPFAALAPGDVLFIDSSHIAMPGSDVDFLFGRVLPALPAGVLLHIHDIFLPDGYPQSWSWRGYNEQALAAALLGSGGYEPLFASHFVATRMTAELARTSVGRLPLPEGAMETSLWLRKSTPAVGPMG